MRLTSGVLSHRNTPLLGLRGSGNAGGSVMLAHPHPLWCTTKHTCTHGLRAAPAGRQIQCDRPGAWQNAARLGTGALWWAGTAMAHGAGRSPGPAP